MGERTEIAWTDHTFNPWQGCVKVDELCDHCYAETISVRIGQGSRWGADGDREVTGDGYWRNPLKWDRAAEARGRPALVFCGSMCDVFEPRLDLEHVTEARHRLWELIARTPHLRWLLLTKRPENVLLHTPMAWRFGQNYTPGQKVDPSNWPENVWVGTSVGTRAGAAARIPYLLSIPAPVRFLSCEPMLEPIDLLPHTEWVPREGGIDWVICGGESGGHARPMHPGWARHLREQCAREGIPFFFKQWGEYAPLHEGDEPRRTDLWLWDDYTGLEPTLRQQKWALGNVGATSGRWGPFGDALIRRYGKDKAGHLLDGVEHYVWPAAAGDREATTVEIRGS